MIDRVREAQEPKFGDGLESAL